MKKMLFLLSLISFSATGAEVSCQVKKNLESVLEMTLEVGDGERVLIGEIDQFKFFIKNLENEKFEIEVYDRTTPSRQYSRGSGNLLKWTLWNRQLILELECSLNLI